MAWKYERREKKLKSRKNVMPKHGRSLFTIQDIQNKRKEQLEEKELK